MTDFSVDFLGCKISQTDAEGIRDALEAAGHSAAGEGPIRVVNTCCITAEAEKKSRKKVRQLLDDAAEDARVFVTGCGATLHPDSFASIDERVSALPGSAALHAQSIVAAADALGALGCKGASPVAQRTRAFVKIQDGCDFTCSYCIVPTVRGASRSRSVDAIVADVRRRVSRGQREIVLTGVNIGLFRDKERKMGLPQLATAVADVEGVARVRISSIEINHVTRRLVDAMVAHPRICNHLHVPMQSGDDRVLRDMRRNYDSARYVRAIDRARAAMPDLNLTTDVIVGFPTEDDDAFRRTAQVAEQVGFTKVHVFPFSARPGTDADAAGDPVAAQVKQQRSRVLRQAAQVRAEAAWRSQIGCVDDVVVERSRGGEHGGYTRAYFPVRVHGEAGDGDHVRIRLDAVASDGLVGTVVDTLSHGPAPVPVSVVHEGSHG